MRGDVQNTGRVDALQGRLRGLFMGKETSTWQERAQSAYLFANSRQRTKEDLGKIYLS